MNTGKASRAFASIQIKIQLSSSRVRHLYAGLACETGWTYICKIRSDFFSTSCSLRATGDVFALPTPVVEVSPVRAGFDDDMKRKSSHSFVRASGC